MKAKLIFILFIITGEAYSHEYENLWGIQQQNFINSLASAEYTIFRPSEKPDYKNRIISFFYAMGGDCVSVNILRVKGMPEIDYCFFNNMLYSVSEDWGNISTKSTDSIIKKIENGYSVNNIDNKDHTTIITFEKNKNKIILYKKPIDRDIVKLRIFYY
jgi:hypothetical protein